MISLLNISDTVEICVTDKLLNKHFFKTKILDMGDNDTFSTMVPSSETGRPVLFFKDVPYELFAKFEEGIIVWNINYIGSDHSEGILACNFQAVSGPEITQRREYFRQPVSVDCNFLKQKSLDKNGEEDFTDISEEFQGHINDLSGGGCAFLSNEFLQVGSKIDMYFNFRDHPLQFSANILDRTEFIKSRSKYEFKYRVSWDDPKARAVDTLVQLVFEQQRDIIAKNKSIIETLEDRRARLWE